MAPIRLRSRVRVRSLAGKALPMDIRRSPLTEGPSKLQSRRGRPRPRSHRSLGRWPDQRGCDSSIPSLPHSNLQSYDQMSPQMAYIAAGTLTIKDRSIAGRMPFTLTFKTDTAQMTGTTDATVATLASGNGDG